MVKKRIAVGGAVLAGGLVLAAGCGSSSKSPAGTGGASTSHASSSSSRSSSSSSSSAKASSSSASSGGGAGGASTVSSSSGGEGGAPPCALKATCNAVDKTCVGLVSNAGLTKFGLRMTELDLTSPAALASGELAAAASSDVTLNDPTCNQSGSGSFSWLLQFDTTAGTLKTGGAKPVVDATQGFSFDTETVGGVQIAPTLIAGVTPSVTGVFATAVGAAVAIPIFDTASAAPSIILPLRGLLLSGALSSGNDCIGSYNAAGLQASNGCQPQAPVTGFVDKGKLQGFITLEDADAVVITELNETLCVLLAGGGVTSDAGNGVMVCARDGSGNITFQGNWCSTTDKAGGCADAVLVAGNFAAGSVKILN